MTEACNFFFTQVLKLTENTTQTYRCRCGGEETGGKTSRKSITCVFAWKKKTVRPFIRRPCVTWRFCFKPQPPSVGRTRPVDFRSCRTLYPILKSGRPGADLGRPTRCFFSFFTSRRKKKNTTEKSEIKINPKRATARERTIEDEICTRSTADAARPDYTAEYTTCRACVRARGVTGKIRGVFPRRLPTAARSSVPPAFETAGGHCASDDCAPRRRDTNYCRLRIEPIPVAGKTFENPIFLTRRSR